MKIKIKIKIKMIKIIYNIEDYLIFTILYQKKKIKMRIKVKIKKISKI